MLGVGAVAVAAAVGCGDASGTTASPENVAYSPSALTTASGLRSSADTPFGYLKLNRDPAPRRATRSFAIFACCAVPLSAPWVVRRLPRTSPDVPYPPPPS